MGNKEDLWSMEEEFFSKDSKASRKERKLASSKDRSKYKKTDQDQLKKRAIHKNAEKSPDLKQGRVLAIQPEGIVVCSDQAHYLCALKGALKKDKNKIKNLVAVGDFVFFEEKAGNQGSIVEIEKRYSILSRADNLSRNKEQLIAVNIDQVLITTSVMSPPLKPSLVDRYIIAAMKGNMEPIIIINKIDLLEPNTEEKNLFDEFVKTYKALDFQVLAVSLASEEGISDLKEAMHGKTSVFSGQSGVGKSSLINRIVGTSLPTGDIVQKTQKGSHTTSTTHLVPLEGGGFCIDTPGIKSFGVWDLMLEQVASYFSEIAALSGECKFPDCSHLNEPECAVKKAVLEKRISSLRFRSYCALMASLSEEHKQR